MASSYTPPSADNASENVAAEPPARRVYGGQVPRHRNARPTEVAAAERMEHIAPTLRTRVLAWHVEAGENGLSDAETGAIYAESRGLHPSDGSSRWSAASRRCELLQAGYVADSGRTRGGCVVWIWTGKPGDGRDVVLPRRKRTRTNHPDAHTVTEFSHV